MLDALPANDCSHGTNPDTDAVVAKRRSGSDARGGASGDCGSYDAVC